MRARAGALACFGASVALISTGCTSEERADSSATPEAVAPTSSIAPSATTTSIVSAPNTAPPLSATQPHVLGSFEFGADPDTVISMARGAVGIPTFDPSKGFDHPAGHMICWADLCMQFAGTDSPATFVGWEYWIR